MNRHLVFAILLVFGFVPAVLSAQQLAPAADGWNSERAIELIRRAQQRRAEAHADTGLLNYRADARAYVYFYLDRQDTGERNLVKTDQVALDVAWQAPDRTKQRIVGWRDRKSLPTSIQYHIDHLAVVLENFGNEIRIGDGDEVSDVVHPAAPGADSFYEYRLVDSLTLRLPGNPEPVRVYEIQVRPRDPGQPAFLGSVFVEQRAGDLVRMDFTFTPSAYRDRFLDYINISLDNGLWKGRFWLPNQQRIEIRRELPELDIPAGSVIRGVMRVGNYRFNEAMSPATFLGPAVTVAPREQRESFSFDEDIHAELREQGIGPEIEMSEIRRQAAELARGRALNRLGGLRLGVPGASEALRYNRAEGAVLALGASYRPLLSLAFEGRAGWAFGPDHPLGEVGLSGQRGALRVETSAFANAPRDVGIGPATSGVINTLSSLLAGRDYLDPFYASGAGMRARWSVAPNWALYGGAGVEAQRSAEAVADFSVFGAPTDFRPVRPIEKGMMFRGSLGLTRAVPAEAAHGWAAELRSGIGSLQTEDRTRGSLSFVQPEARASWGRRWDSREARVEVGGAAGFTAWGELPPQALFLIGGRGTLPGYDFRAFGGDRYALANVTASAEVLRPWLRARALGALGWTQVGEAGERARLRWGVEPTGDIRASIGGGIGILYDILHVDLARGLNRGGEWELIVEARRSFWDFL